MGVSLAIFFVSGFFGWKLHENYFIVSFGLSLALGIVLAACFPLAFAKNEDGSTSFWSSRLKRKTLAGTGETHVSAVISQLNRFAADSARKFGSRQGREGVLIRRTRDEKGNVLVPWSKFFAGFLLVGKSGAGKSSGILYPLIEEIMTLKKVCVMVADAKGDYTQMLFKREKRAKCIDEPDNKILKKVYLLNPVDRDSIKFKLEIRTSQEAAKLASIFIKKADNDNPYFVDTARNVLGGILIGLQKKGYLSWQSLFEVISDDDIDLLRGVLNLSPEGKLALSDISPDAPEQLTGILSSLKKEIKFLAPIAKAWHEPDFSIRDFIRDADGVVILRFDKQNAELSGKMIQIFFEMALCEIAPQEDYNDNTYVFFGDELQNLPRLDLPYSTSFLRSKCLAHVLSHQDVNRMQKIYGKENYNSIFENLESIVVLNSGPETAEWFSKAFGDRRILQESSSNSQSMGANMTLGESVNDSISVERTINMGRIINLPVPIQTGNVTGLFKTAGVDISEITWDQSITTLKPIYIDFIEAEWVQI